MIAGTGVSDGDGVVSAVGSMVALGLSAVLCPADGALSAVVLGAHPVSSARATRVVVQRAVGPRLAGTAGGKWAVMVLLNREGGDEFWRAWVNRGWRSTVPFYDAPGCDSECPAVRDDHEGIDDTPGSDPK